jgi:hypothetical protein
MWSNYKPDTYRGCALYHKYTSGTNRGCGAGSHLYKQPLGCGIDFVGVFSAVSRATLLPSSKPILGVSIVMRTDCVVA